MRKSKNLIGLAILTFIIAVSFLTRLDDIKKENGHFNVEATYHSLMIIKSFDENPISSHLFLPIMTFGGEINKNIPWGGAVPTKDKLGNFIYTSFPGFGFAAPYFVLKLTHAKLSILNLQIFNLLIQLAASAIFFVTLYKISKSNYPAVIAALSCLPLLLSKEALTSNGLVYWPHSLSQILIALILLSLAMRSEEKKSYQLITIGILVFFWIMTEWTGLIFSALSCLVLFYSKSFRDRKLSVSIATFTLIAMLTYFLQFQHITDVHEFINRSLYRFQVRSGASTVNFKFYELFGSYIQSFGLYLIFIATTLAMLKGLRDNRTLLLLMIMSLGIMIENIILAQHAFFYTFDRLKLGFFIGLCIFYTFSRFNINLRALAALTLVAASIYSVISYRSSVSNFHGWSEMQQQNARIVAKTLGIDDFDCASIFNDTIVRSYLNLLLNRSIYEYVPDAEQIKSLVSKNDCPVIIIHGKNKFRDIEEISSVDIYTKNGLNTIK